MFAELIQLGLNGSTLIIVVAVGALLIAALAVFLVRSGAAKRKRDVHMRARMIEMEREAQFDAAAERVAPARTARRIAAEVSRLFDEYLSSRVLAVYAGRESDARLTDVLGSSDSNGGSIPGAALPRFQPAQLLEQGAGPRVGKMAALLGQPAPTSEAAPAPGEVTGGELDRGGDTLQEPGAAPNGGGSSPSQEVWLLPWRGAFQWQGLIVATVAASVPEESLETYREPISHLTDRLAVSLELESTDAALAALDQRAARAARFSRALIACLEESSPLSAIAREARALVDADSAALWRVDESTGMITMAASDGLKSTEFLPLPLGQGLAGHAAQTGETLALQDAPADPRCIFPREARESGIVSYLGSPLIAEGRPVGVIEVHSATERAWTPDERSLLEFAATLISDLIRTSDSRGNRLKIEGAYLGLSEALQRLRSPDEVKGAVVEVLGHAVGASRVVIAEFGAAGQTEPVKHEHRQRDVRSALEARFGESLVSRVAASNAPNPIAIADSAASSLMEAAQAAELGVLSELALPIRVDGKTSAIVYVHQCDRAREWKPEEIEFCERVTRQLSLSLSNLAALERASADASQARAELARMAAGATSPRVAELEQKLQSMERVLEHSRSIEEQARDMLAKASALEAKARAEAEVARRAEAQLRTQVESVDEDRKRLQNSAQQLLEINRLKSEFIVNAGREIEGALQSVLGVAELLERGSYGALSAEQREAVHGLYSSARRIKSDVDWLIEYGSTRSRRLEASEKA